MTLVRVPAYIGRSLGIGTHIIPESRLNRLVPHELLEMGGLFGDFRGWRVSTGVQVQEWGSAWLTA